MKLETLMQSLWKEYLKTKSVVMKPYNKNKAIRIKTDITATK